MTSVTSSVVVSSVTVGSSDVVVVVSAVVVVIGIVSVEVGSVISSKVVLGTVVVGGRLWPCRRLANAGNSDVDSEAVVDTSVVVVSETVVVSASASRLLVSGAIDVETSRTALSTASSIASTRGGGAGGDGRIRCPGRIRWIL